MVEGQRLSKLPKMLHLAPHVVQKMYDTAQKLNERTEPKARLSAGQLGDCQRNLWAELAGVPNERPVSGRIATLFGHGHKVEEHVIESLTIAGYGVLDVDPKTGDQFMLLELDGRLKGFIDGKIRLAKDAPFMLLEIKSANDKQFQLCVEMGYEAWNPKYAAQIQVYMGYFKLEDSLVIVYNKNDSNIHAEKIRFDQARFDELIAKAHYILSAETIVPKPAEAKSRYCALCKWCDRGDWCWGPLSEVQFDD